MTDANVIDFYAMADGVKQADVEAHLDQNAIDAAFKEIQKSFFELVNIFIYLEPCQLVLLCWAASSQCQ